MIRRDDYGSGAPQYFGEDTAAAAASSSSSSSSMMTIPGVASQQLMVVEGETSSIGRSSLLPYHHHPHQEGGQLVSLTQPNLAMVPLANQRTSRLKEHNYQLTGHSDKVFSLAFDPTGNHLASASMDASIFLWDVYGGFLNYNVLKGHKSAVLEVKWSSPQMLVSASADKTVKLWDAHKGEKIRNYSDHGGIVNCVAVARNNANVLASGSDDCTAILWDTRHRRSVHTFYHDYQITSVCLSHDGTHIYTGGIDNIIRRFDVRGDVNIPDLELVGHRDTITGLAMSPDGTHLLSNSMDCSIGLWDVRPFVSDPSRRSVRQFVGAQHGAEKNLLRCGFSHDGRFVTAGSSDRMVYVWETDSGRPAYVLPGHKGSVNDVIFHPHEPIVASGSTDKTIYAGELSK